MLNDNYRVVDTRSQWIIQRRGDKAKNWTDWKFCATLDGLMLFASKPYVAALPERLTFLTKLPDIHPR